MVETWCYAGSRHQDGGKGRKSFPLLEKKGEIVLVAASSQTIRGLVAWILEDGGYRCVMASNRAELRVLLKNQVIHAVIVDLVDAEFEYPPVPPIPHPVILLLENGVVPRSAWKSSRVMGLIIKPFSSGQLLSSVASVCGERIP